MALALHQRTLEHTPEDDTKNRGTGLDNIACCFVKLEEYPQAVKVATAATEKNKTFGEAWFRLGTAHALLQQWTEAAAQILEHAMAVGGMTAKNEADAHQNLQIAKEQLAAQQAKAAADAEAVHAVAEQAVAEQAAKDKLVQEQAEAALAEAAAEQAEQKRLTAIPFTCCVCESVSQTRLHRCNACLAALGENDTERPRYCSKAYQKSDWKEHHKVCVSNRGGAAAAPSKRAKTKNLLHMITQAPPACSANASSTSFRASLSVHFLAKS